MLMGSILFEVSMQEDADTCRIQSGGQAVPTPLKNHKNIGFLSNTGPDPLKNHKATKPVFNVGPSLALHLNGVSLARF